MKPIAIPALGTKSSAEEKVLIEAEKKLVIAIGAVFQDVEMNLAWQKAMEIGWIRLWDIQPVTPKPMQPPGPDNIPIPCRVFRLTNSGQERLHELQKRREIDSRMAKQ